MNRFWITVALFAIDRMKFNAKFLNNEKDDAKEQLRFLKNVT